MYKNAPHNYICPFCLLINGIKNEHVLSVQSDIFCKNDDIIAFISSHQWPNNSGHALIVPKWHFKNIYELSVEFGCKVFTIAQQTALAMKRVYGCDGISTRQHNEPTGNQDVWHYHLHVFPRYKDDKLYLLEQSEMPIEKRAQFAHKLKDYFIETFNE